MIRVRDLKQIISGAFLIGLFLLLLFCVSGESELNHRLFDRRKYVYPCSNYVAISFLSYMCSWNEGEN